MMSSVSGYYGADSRRGRARDTGRGCILLGTAFRKFTSVERLVGGGRKTPVEFRSELPSFLMHARPPLLPCRSFSFVRTVHPDETIDFFPGY